MKNHLLLFLLCVSLSACSKKTLLSDKVRTSFQSKKTIDTSTSKATFITDKTVTTINKLVDTNLTIKGKALSASFFLSQLKNDTSVHFENEDVELFLKIEKTGNAIAIAKPKPKTITVKALEKINIYNDIVKTEESNTATKEMAEVNSDSKLNRSEKQTSGLTFSFTLIIISLIAIVAVFIFVVRKLNLLLKVFG